MQPGWARWAERGLGALLTLLLLCSGLEGKKSSFTVNHIWMESQPGWTVPNGQNLTLRCVVDISSTSNVKPQRTMLFYRDDVMVHNVSSRRNMEKISIPQARVYDSGTYKCTVILNKLEKTTGGYMVAVKGVPSPRVTLDKKEATEGEEVAVTCAVEEERGPIHFMIEKLELDRNIVKRRREKTSQHDNSVTIKFPIEEQDHVLIFFCKAAVISGRHVETSEFARSEMLTVWEVFSVPTVHVRPPGLIKEGDELYIRCTIQAKPWASETPELIIQKDKEIVISRYCHTAMYRVTARVDHSGNYTCKVEYGHLSKVSSIEVKVTERTKLPWNTSP